MSYSGVGSSLGRVEMVDIVAVVVGKMVETVDKMVRSFMFQLVV
jgi:hypothetical protein